MSRVVTVRLWGTTIGHLGYAPGQSETASFEYDSGFAASGINISPLTMPCPPRLHSFPNISQRSFHGLPGIFADSLPDRFGSQLIDMFMADRGIPPEKVTALDRLLYIGERGMGALEYQPAQEFSQGDAGAPLALDIHALSRLASAVASRDLSRRAGLLSAGSRSEALRLIRVGSSAGGARAKALVALAPDGRVFDGSGECAADCTQWILKFDVDENEDRDGRDPKGMTRVEYIYAIIARECGIWMPQTDYIEDGADFHYLIKRFDRIDSSSGRGMGKLHYASWSALAHADRDVTGAHSYTELVLLARRLGLGQDSVTEIFRRAVFNVLGRNQDDHAKNFGFLMDRSGSWSLSPAFDLTYAYDPQGAWTRMQQTRLNGKQDGFTREDILSFGRDCNLSHVKAQGIVDAIMEALSRFPTLAKEYGMPRELAKTVEGNMRLKLA